MKSVNPFFKVVLRLGSHMSVMSEETLHYSPVSLSDINLSFKLNITKSSLIYVKRFKDSPNLVQTLFAMYVVYFICFYANSLFHIVKIVKTEIINAVYLCTHTLKKV